MKSDRRTYKTQYLPSGGIPLARGDTGDESIAQLTCHNDQWRCLPTRSCLKRAYVISIPIYRESLPECRWHFGRQEIFAVNLDFSSRSCGTQNDRSNFLDDNDNKRLVMTDCRGSTLPSLKERSFNPDQQWKWSPPRGKPPTGFSESGVGEFIRRLLARHVCGGFGGPPDVECDVGQMLDKLVSSELETTRLIEDEVCNGCCFTMDSKRFQLCQN